jgi:hypothetical protein
VQGQASSTLPRGRQAALFFGLHSAATPGPLNQTVGALGGQESWTVRAWAFLLANEHFTVETDR